MIKRVFSVSVPHPKGGAFVWTCAKDHIFNEKKDYKKLDYVGLIINHLRKRRVGGLERDWTGILI